MKTHNISTKRLDITTIKEVVFGDYQLSLSEEAVSNITKCRAYLDKKMETHEGPIYGINTGFGSLYKHSISKEDLGTLQKNLVMSHACGTGD